MTIRSISPKKAIIYIGAFLMSILTLQLLSIHNGFPLLLGDSKNYICMGLDYAENSHWSNFYIYFVGKNIELFNSVQWIPLIQNTMILVMLFTLCHLLFKKHTLIKYIAIVTALVFTALPWISNMVMTDISTTICLLSILILVNYRLPLKYMGLLYLVLLLSASWHQSHILIMPLFFVAATIVKLLQERSNLKQQIRDIGLKTIPLIAVLIMSFLLEKNILDKPVPVSKKTQTTKSTKPSDTSSGYYFVGVRLWEVEELDNLLTVFCPDHPGNYLCHPENNPPIKIQMSTFRERNQDDEKYIRLSQDNKEFILSCLTVPRFYYAMIKAAMKRSFDLLEHTRIKLYEPSIPNEPKKGNYNQCLNKISKQELAAFRSAKQKNGAYVGKFYNRYLIMDKIWWFIVLPLVLIFSFYTKYKHRGSNILTKDQWFGLLALPLAHIVNTVVCATFSNANNFRYSSRTIWLVNLAVILLLIFIIEFRIKQQSSQDETNRTDTLS